MNGKRINWDAEWVLEHFDSATSLKDLCKEYNAEHGTDICYRSFKGFCQRRGMKKSKLTEEQDQFIRDNYPTLGGVKLTEAYNSKFGTQKTYRQMKSLVNNRKLTIADEEVFRDCRVNKRGCKYQIGEVSEGWQEPYVKVGENKFVAAGRYMYEQANGEVPKGYMVIHLDGDIQNYSLGNLQAIPKAYTAKMMRNKLWSHHPTITKGAIMLCELQEKIEGMTK